MRVRRALAQAVMSAWGSVMTWLICHDRRRGTLMASRVAKALLAVICWGLPRVDEPET